MGERTDELGDEERSPYGATGAVPPNDEVDEALITGRADLGDTGDTGAVKDPDKVDVTDRYRALSGAPDADTLDVTDRDQQLAARAEAARGLTPDTTGAMTGSATSDAAIGAAMGAATGAAAISGASATSAVAVMSKASDNPDQIREHIEETRTEMRQTIDEIQERLSPRRLTQQAADTMRGAARNTGQSLWTAIRKYPIPAALVGLALGWLLYKALVQAMSGGATSSSPPTPRRRRGFWAF